MAHAIPVVIGVGDVVNRSQKLEDAKEPSQLILEAIQNALDDADVALNARLKLQQAIDSISVVRTWTWPYPDLPGLVSSKLGINPTHKEYTDHGGNQPGRIFDDAARRISQNKCGVAVVTGGEALAFLSSFAKARKLPPPGWTKLDTRVDSVFSATSREHQQGLRGIHDVGAPIHIYPLYENAFRAHQGQSITENNDESANMYAAFADIAKENKYAWNYGKAETQQSIGNVSERNRMICFPYPLLMNAFNTVNLAGACILTSTSFAEELGVPKSKWVYPLGGAGTRDSYDFWERPNFHSAPCISRSLDAALQVSGLTKDQVDCFDFYSCFPIVPKLACKHLGLSITNPEKPITLLGGLTSFGGAGNNYSMHALTAMVRKLRTGNMQKGLVLANGGVTTYQYVVCLSTEPRADSSAYPAANPLPAVVTDVPVPQVDAIAKGDAVVETYTVEFDRKGKPKRGHVVGRLKRNGHRFIANHGDNATLQELLSFSKEPIGREGHVKQDPNERERNLFYFADSARL